MKSAAKIALVGIIIETVVTLIFWSVDYSQSWARRSSFELLLKSLRWINLFVSNGTLAYFFYVLATTRGQPRGEP